MTQPQLTYGTISHQLISLSVPLLAGNILQQLYNTVDAVIVGRFVGDAAFGAVGVAGSVMNLFLFLISGGCDGVGTLLSRFYGAGDGKRSAGIFICPAYLVRACRCCSPGWGCCFCRCCWRCSKPRILWRDTPQSI